MSTSVSAAAIPVGDLVVVEGANWTVVECAGAQAVAKRADGKTVLFDRATAKPFGHGRWYIPVAPSA